MRGALWEMFDGGLVERWFLFVVVFDGSNGDSRVLMIVVASGAEDCC